MSHIILEKEEVALLSSPDVFLIKKRLGKKIELLLGECIAQVNDKMRESDVLQRLEFESAGPKISKGENYLSFPWHILDYPRIFHRENIFAIRTLCWWGQGFSVTLHLSGKYAEQYVEVIDRHLSFFGENDYNICIQKDQWQHHFQSDNYEKAKQLYISGKTIKDFYKEYGFIKIMKKIPLSEWKNLTVLAAEIYGDFFRVLSNN